MYVTQLIIWLLNAFNHIIPVVLSKNEEKLRLSFTQYLKAWNDVSNNNFKDLNLETLISKLKYDLVYLLIQFLINIKVHLVWFFFVHGFVKYFIHCQLIKGTHRIYKLCSRFSLSCEFGHIWLYWLCYLDNKFHALQARISFKTYSKPLKHAISPLVTQVLKPKN